MSDKNDNSEKVDSGKEVVFRSRPRISKGEAAFFGFLAAVFGHVTQQTEDISYKDKRVNDAGYRRLKGDPERYG